MAIIPRAKENVQMEVGSPVPIAGTGDARIRGEAMQSFGKAVTQFGMQQVAFEQNLNYKEATAEISNTMREGHEFAKRNAAPDGSNYQEVYDSFTKDKIDEIYNQKTSGMGIFGRRTKRELDSFLKTANSASQTEAMIASSRMREQNNYDRLESSANDDARAIRQAADPVTLSARMREWGSMLDKTVMDGGMSAETAAKSRAIWNERAAEALVQGYADKEMYGRALEVLEPSQQNRDLFTEMDPKNARQLGFIDSREEAALNAAGEKFKVPVMSKGDKAPLTPEMAVIMRGLSPSRRDTLIDQMKAKAREATAVRLADLNAQVNGFEAIALSGGQYSQEQVTKLISDINSAPNMTLSAKKRSIDAIRSADAVNKQLMLVSSTPRAEWGQILDGVDKKMNLAAQEAANFDPRMGDVGNDFAVQANRMKNKEVLERSLQAIRRAQDDDAASFVTQNDQKLNVLYRGTKDGDPEGTATYLRNSLAKQSYLGIPVEKQRVLMKSDAVAMANRLAIVRDSGQMNQELAAMQEQYGPYFPRVMKELAQVDKDLEGFQTLAYAPVETRQKLVDAISNEKQINQAIEADPFLKEQKTNIAVAVESATARFRGAIIASSNDTSSVEFNNTIQKQVALQVKRDLVKDPNGDPSKFAERAYRDLIESTYDVVDGGRNSKVIVPRVIGNRHMDTKIVGDFMDVYSNAENFKDLNVAGNDAYKENLAKSHRWVTNSTQTGLRLMEVLPDGNLQPVYNTEQKEVVMSYEEINLRPSKKVKDANKGFLGRLFD